MIRSLHLASMDTFRKSVMGLGLKARMHFIQNVIKEDILGLDHQPKFARPKRHYSTGRTDYVELVRKGYEYFNKFKGLVADKTYSFAKRDDCREYFRSIAPEDALTIIEVELNFIYEYFFTKASVLQTKVGCICRFASFSSILAALFVFFCDKKHAFSKLDVKVSYILLLGAVGLEFVAFLMLILSDWAAIGGNPLIKHFLQLKKPRWSNCKKEPFTKFKALSTNPLFRRWSGAISGCDLITRTMNLASKMAYIETLGTVRASAMVILYAVIFCLGGHDAVELASRKWTYKAKNPFLKELWEFVFLELERKSRIAEDAEMVKIICEARGGWSVQESELEEREKGKLKPYVNSNDVAFDENLIVWHIATNICYHADDWSDQIDTNPNSINDHRYFSKVSSDYMYHLLETEPAIMSTVAGMGQERTNEIFSIMEELRQESMSFIHFVDLKSKKVTQSTCRNVLTASIDFRTEGRKKSKLLTAVALAKELVQLETNKRRKTVAQVWIEMLSYTAINCRPEAHVRQLSKGGELISIVWLLMLHFGLGTRQFKKQASEEEPLLNTNT